MALLWRPPGKLLVALLDRQAAYPAVWMRAVVRQLPEMQACLPAEPPPTANVGDGARRGRPCWSRLLEQRIRNHYLMQPELEVGRAVQELGLPEPVAAAVLQQLPGPTCCHAQLRSAVQHPTATRLLLQHLQKAAEGGNSPAIECWGPDVFQAAVLEAAQLGDVCLLNSFAASFHSIGKRAGQLKAAKQGQRRQEQQPQQEEHELAVQQAQQTLEQQKQRQQALVQRYCEQYMCSLAYAALRAAADGGRFEVLHLAAAPARHAASPAAQMLQLGISSFAEEAAMRGQLAMLHRLLQEAAPPLDTCQLLCAAIHCRQLPAFQLVLSKCGMPADAEPACQAAIRSNQVELLRLLAAQGGLPQDVGRLVATAIKADRQDAVECLLEQGGPPADLAGLMVSAVEHRQPHLVAVMLARAGPPADAQPLLMAAIQHNQPALAQQLLQHCSLPADTAPLLMAAVEHDQPELVSAIVSKAGVPADVERLLVAAARKDQPSVVQLLLAESGQAPSAEMLAAAIRAPSPACVQALLAAASGPFPVAPLAGTVSLPFAGDYSCPVLYTLQMRARTLTGRNGPFASAAKLLLVWEQLLAAGFRPTIYENVQVVRQRAGPAQQAQRFDPIAEDPGLALQGANRFMWLALEHPDWSTEEHRRFQPRFKRAVQALLLAVHRSRREESSAGSSSNNNHSSGGSALLRHLAALPDDLLLHIAGQAAYPLSAWAPGV